MPLYLELAPQARQDIDDAILWLKALDSTAATRFTDALTEALATLAVRLQEQLEEHAPLPIDEDASLALSRPILKHLFFTGKTRQRRSSAGVWRLYFDLRDNDQDGKPDTLRVVTIRHGAAAPLWNPRDQDQE